MVAEPIVRPPYGPNAPLFPRTEPKHHAPIFRRKGTFIEVVAPRADISHLPPVTPLGVFVARGRGFSAIVRPDVSQSDALALIFAELPLSEFGWKLDETEIWLLGQRGGFPLYRVERH
jgi:hypothetical protein